MTVHDKISRVLYYKTTGSIIHQLFIDAPDQVTDFAILEIPAGTYNHDTHYIDRISENGEPVLKEWPLTPDQLRVKQLEEDVLLLKMDSEIGGGIL